MLDAYNKTIATIAVNRGPLKHPAPLDAKRCQFVLRHKNQDPKELSTFLKEYKTDNISSLELLEKFNSATYGFYAEKTSGTPSSETKNDISKEARKAAADSADVCAAFLAFLGGDKNLYNQIELYCSQEALNVFMGLFKNEDENYYKFGFPEKVCYVDVSEEKKITGLTVECSLTHLCIGGITINLAGKASISCKPNPEYWQKNIQDAEDGTLDRGYWMLEGKPRFTGFVQTVAENSTTTVAWPINHPWNEIQSIILKQDAAHLNQFTVIWKKAVDELIELPGVVTVIPSQSGERTYYSTTLLTVLHQLAVSGHTSTFRPTDADLKAAKAEADLYPKLSVIANPRDYNTTNTEVNKAQALMYFQADIKTISEHKELPLYSKLHLLLCLYRHFYHLELAGRFPRDGLTPISRYKLDGQSVSETTSSIHKAFKAGIQCAMAADKENYGHLTTLAGLSLAELSCDRDAIKNLLLIQRRQVLADRKVWAGVGLLAVAGTAIGLTCLICPLVGIPIAIGFALTAKIGGGVLGFTGLCSLSATAVKRARSATTIASLKNQNSTLEVPGISESLATPN